MKILSSSLDEELYIILLIKIMVVFSEAATSDIANRVQPGPLVTVKRFLAGNLFKNLNLH